MPKTKKEEQKKVPLSVTISKDLADFLEAEIKTSRFASVSHGVEYCVRRVKEQIEKGQIT
jgi:Arc/MetJ-type ribon-helix-helix transcriptional regulator